MTVLDFWTLAIMLTEVWRKWNLVENINNAAILTTEADETNYYVLATDYFQYAVGWGCENIEEGPNQSREFFWVLSRTPVLPEEPYRERVDGIIDQFFDRTHIRSTDQLEELWENLRN